MRLALLIGPAAALALGACVSEAGESPAPAARATGASIDCIPASQIVARRPAGPDAIIFEMANGQVYRNELPAACPRLARANAVDQISFDVEGAQLCSSDRFRVFDPVEPRAGGLRSIPECRLGAFTPVEPGR